MNEESKAIKNRQLFQILAGFTKAGQYRGLKFAYAVAKNIRLLQSEIAALQEPYNKARIALCEEYAIRNDDETPKKTIKDGQEQYEIKDQPAFDAALMKLNLEQGKVYEGNSDIVLHRIKFADVPADINGDVLAGIMDVIDE